MPIQIQPRDCKIMRFVFACRVVSYDQIVRRHFNGTHEKTAWKRLRRLVKCGFFKVGTLELNGHCARIVQPMPTVWPYICEKFPFTIETPHFKSESPEHDVRATEVFMRFEKLECYRTFFTENLLQSSLAFVEDERFADVVRMQPDGVLIVSDAKKTERVYAVELELSKKSPARYREKLAAYYLARGIDGVLYISSRREVERLIARMDEEIRSERSSILYFSSEANVLAEVPQLIFTTSEGAKLEFC